MFSLSSKIRGPLSRESFLGWQRSPCVRNNFTRRSKQHNACGPRRRMIIRSKMEIKPRVLSIQSHVVHGYVGNKCAAFCLQRLGLEVDVVNTVHFSNHTGYPFVTGTLLTGTEFAEIGKGLKKNSLARYTHVLTGFIGREEVLEKTVAFVRELKEECSDLVFVCDPVMGDDGQLYTPPELLEMYKLQVAPLADVLLPNQFEAEMLSGVQITSIASAQEACQKLHALGPQTIILTSMNDPAAPDGNLTLYCSTMKQQKEGHRSRFKIQVPKLECKFTGSGDVLAALLLALIQERPMELDWACKQALSRLHKVLSLTLDRAKHKGDLAEIELVAGQHYLVQTNETFFALDCE